MTPPGLCDSDANTPPPTVGDDCRQATFKLVNKEEEIRRDWWWRGSFEVSHTGQKGVSIAERERRIWRRRKSPFCLGHMR